MYIPSSKNDNASRYFRSLSRIALGGLSALFVFCLASCSSQRFLQEEQTVLSDVKLSSSQQGFKASSLRSYIRQEPNSKWFSLFKVPLGIYCLSKADSVKGHKGFSRILRNIGEAPVIYNSQATYYSVLNLEQAMRGMGYYHCKADTVVTRKGHKTQVEYKLSPGVRHYVSELSFRFDDERMHSAFLQDSSATLLRVGMPLNTSKLSDERTRIIQALHDRGYYYLHNDYITYDIDTIAGEQGASVTLQFRRPAGADTLRAYVPQRFRRIRVYEDAFPDTTELDSTYYRGLTIFYHNKLKQNRRVYSTHIGVAPDSLYKETALQNSYGSLSALPPVSFTNLQLRPVADAPDLLDCNISLRRNKPHSIGAELEGTNTSGDLGAALALTYSNRNLLRGAELFSIKLRGAYEAITGLEGYSNQNYIEWSGEMSLRFPTLMLPFVNLEKRHSLKASSEVQLMYDSQERPEFHRRVLTGAWAYHWTPIRDPRISHTYDMFSLDYVYMPWISDTFRADYLEGDDPHYAVLRYSYDNLLIMRMGYSFTFNSIRDNAGSASGLYQKNGYQIKLAAEIAGNLLYGISKLAHSSKGSSGMYEFLGIAYSQYAKFDFDYVKSFVLNSRNSIALHTAFGISIPYGNSRIIPYEKRYFAGGANSVRGWSVRELGPGSYRGRDGKIDFINQTGNLKLDLSAEFRTFLFWKIHAALFIDAGNIWNTRDYADMDGAKFKFNRFYKQIAVAYGLGVRLNFDYFILRLDGGMKAVNPQYPSGKSHYPIIAPNFNRDFTLHFAVGLPF